MNRILPIFLLSLFFLLQPGRLHAQLDQCPTCKKAIANCPYNGKHPKPEVKVSFSMHWGEPSALLFIDGEQKDSISYGQRKSYMLKHGTHIVKLTAKDMEDYTESIKVGSNTSTLYPFKMNRAFTGKSAAQIKSIGDDYLNGTSERMKNEKEAYLWYEKAAEMGYAPAQYLWGNRLLERPKSANDAKTAIDYLRRSAEQGYGNSQYEIGNAYYYGDEKPYYHGCGLAQNYIEALKWYQMAAAQGHSKAIHNVGYIYYRGYHNKERKSDYKEAMKWLSKISNYSSAQCVIGHIYSYGGDGIKEDVDSAMTWYLKAANQGNSIAQKCLGDIYSNGRIIRTRVIHGVVRDAKEILLKKYGDKFGGNNKSTNSNSTNKKKILLKKYGDKFGGNNISTNSNSTNKKDSFINDTIPPDFPQAFIWYTKAAEQDNAEAQVCLAELYIEGKGIRNDTIIAIQWLRKALVIFEKEDDYKSAYNTGLKLILYDRNEYIKSPAMNKKDYSTDLGNTSYYAIFQKKYDEAEKYASEAIAADESQHWRYTNLAASLLLQGKFTKAEAVYKQWKAELKRKFLDDFQIFESRNMLSEELKTEIEKIKKMLNE